VRTCSASSSSTKLLVPADVAKRYHAAGPQSPALGSTDLEAVSLPTELDLTFDRATRRYVTVWRRGARMGVKLKTSQNPQGNRFVK
jgi:hypothetical protein